MLQFCISLAHHKEKRLLVFYRDVVKGFYLEVFHHTSFVKLMPVISLIWWKQQVVINTDFRPRGSCLIGCNTVIGL